jgi:hypothetical protein
MAPDSQMVRAVFGVFGSFDLRERDFIFFKWDFKFLEDHIYLPRIRSQNRSPERNGFDVCSHVDAFLNDFGKYCLS